MFQVTQVTPQFFVTPLKWHRPFSKGKSAAVAALDSYFGLVRPNGSLREEKELKPLSSLPFTAKAYPVQSTPFKGPFCQNFYFPN